MRKELFLGIIMFFIMTLTMQVNALEVEGYPELPEFEQEHYIIYLEASRDNRVELAAFDISETDENICIVWDDELQLYNNFEYRNGVKWYLDGDQWVLFEEGYYCISNNPAGVIASDIEIRDLRNLNSMDPRFEVISKSESKHSTRRFKYNNQFIYFSRIDGNVYMKVTDDGINETESIPLNFEPLHVMQAGGNIILIGFAKPIETTSSRYRHGDFGNSPALVFNSNFEVINTIEYVGYREYFCKVGDRLYVKNSDYTNTTFSDGTASDPRVYESKIITTYYYTDDGGMTWIEVTEDEAKEAKKQEYVLQENYIGYNVLDDGKYIQSKNNPEKKYEIVHEYGNSYTYERVIGSFYSYVTNYKFGEKTYYDNLDRPHGSPRFKYLISIDGINGISIPEYDNQYYTIWMTKDYLYLEDESNYYRMPMSYITDNIIVTYGDKALAFETPPVIENGRTLVHMRFLFEQMGAEVSWDDASKTATVNKQGDIISFSVDNTNANVNNELKTMDVPARLINGKTMIPLRFLSEELGFTVEWDEETRTASVIE